MLKRSPVEIFEANLVEPGKFVILMGGGVAEVEEGLASLIDCQHFVLSQLHIPMVHEDIWVGLRGNTVRPEKMDTIGVIETNLIAGAMIGCDRALKDSFVRLLDLRFGVALGGRGYFVVEGTQHDVESAIERAIAASRSYGGVLNSECIPRPSDELSPWVYREAPFRLR
jgi:microcompartment protein CcmL/EutN